MILIMDRSSLVKIEEHNKSLCNYYISLRLKRKVYKTAIKIVLLYYSEY